MNREKKETEDCELTEEELAEVVGGSKISAAYVRERHANGCKGGPWGPYDCGG